MFKKILIANRGEIAVRIVRACREMKIKSVVAYSTADANSLAVHLADEAVCIGPPAPRDSYLHAPNIISAAHITGAEAIHPGIGFLSERPSFVETVEACGLKFIGPSAAAMERLGDKAKAREAMRAGGVPIVPGSVGAIASDEEALAFVKKTGYPILVKASLGGGGRGIRLVQNEEELSRGIEMARQEAASAFGSSEVYLEKFVEEPRHVEVQVIGDTFGNVIHLGERECSIQNPRRQKIVEEAPASMLPIALRSKLCDAAVKAAKTIGYSCAGTVEFLVDAKGGFYFMEMNKRLQVEHCITEMVTGIDIVKLQIRVAAGEKLGISQKEIKIDGHAIECRINAEQPEKNFTPSTGTLTKVQFPGGYGVRVDTHVVTGYEVSPYYDSLLAKVIAWGKDRNEAISRMERCLGEVEVEGVHTNTNLCKRILADAFYRRGEFSTDFVKRRILT